MFKCVSDNTTELCFSVDGSAVRTTIVLRQPFSNTFSTIELLTLSTLLWSKHDVVTNGAIECLVGWLMECVFRLDDLVLRFIKSTKLFEALVDVVIADSKRSFLDHDEFKIYEI